MNLSKRIIHYGRDDPLPEQYELRAGPLSLVYEAGGLRYIRLGDREILRRIYVAVRDHNWDTIPATFSNRHIDMGEETFYITYDAVHRQRDIDFLWHAALTGDAQGTITFTMEGVARATFRRNRIGFCILHPMQACAGRPCVVEHSDGTLEHSVFPRAIAPHQPFEDIQVITHEVCPRVWAEVRFVGDVFEMEDQRNWTDASYKTYSTPLALPFPVEIPVGMRIIQQVTLTLQCEVPTILASLSLGRIDRGEVTLPLSRPLTLNVSHAPVGRLPHIGLGVASHGQSLNPRTVARLKALHLTHLRVDVPLVALDAGARAGVSALRQASAEAHALGVPLEIALFLSDHAAQELPACVTLLAQLKPPVCRWLIFHIEEKVTSARWVRLARQHLIPYAPAAQVVAGTNAYFAELNRERPSLEELDAMCYALTPQVHAFDNMSLIETLPTQAVTVESARHFVGDLPIVISPVTLRPRFNPNATDTSSPSDRDILPPQVDVRQMSLLGAGWTLGSLKYLAASQVASVTYYETTGWRGVMATEKGSPLPTRFRAPPGAVFPLYHVLADVGAFAGGEVLPVTLERERVPAPVEALALRRGQCQRMLLANVTPVPQRVMVRGLVGECRVRALDERNAARAMTAPELFRTDQRKRLRASQNGLELTLWPYAVACVDADVPETEA